MKVNNTIQKIDSTILVNYILEKIGKMSHLKLQKLLYFIEGYHLAYFKKSLIDDDFEAWVHGPVSRSVYNKLTCQSVHHSDISYTCHENETLPSQILSETLTTGQLELIDEVLELYSNESGLALESITRKQAPWINARKNHHVADKCDEKITREDMLNYFKDFIFDINNG
jgi:uncharacterized phage-associated protein